MKTTVEKLSPTRVKLNIEVTPEELQPSIKHAYEHIASQVNIPGFRKGKVPPQLIDQRVGREEVLNHAVSDGLDKFYRQAVTDEKIRVLGRPEADIATWPDVKDFSGDLVVTVEAAADTAEDDRVVAALGCLLGSSAKLVGGLVVTGGETAAALFRAWGISGLRLIDEIEPGVPRSVAEGACAGLPVVTKAGSFGDAATLDRARMRLRAGVAA